MYSNLKNRSFINSPSSGSNNHKNNSSNMNELQENSITLSVVSSSMETNEVKMPSIIFPKDFSETEQNDKSISFYKLNVNSNEQKLNIENKQKTQIIKSLNSSLLKSSTKSKPFKPEPELVSCNQSSQIKVNTLPLYRLQNQLTKRIEYKKESVKLKQTSINNESKSIINKQGSLNKTKLKFQEQQNTRSSLSKLSLNSLPINNNTANLNNNNNNNNIFSSQNQLQMITPMVRASRFASYHSFATSNNINNYCHSYPLIWYWNESINGPISAIDLLPNVVLMCRVENCSQHISLQTVNFERYLFYFLIDHKKQLVKEENLK